MSQFPEYPAGEDQVLVVYTGMDDGSEVDPGPLFADLAADAAERRSNGWRMVSMASLPLRHGGQKIFGVEGSGFTTKVALGVLYTRAS